MCGNSNIKLRECRHELLCMCHAEELARGGRGEGEAAAVPFPAVHNIHVSWNILFTSLACISFPLTLPFYRLRGCFLENTTAQTFSVNDASNASSNYTVAARKECIAPVHRHSKLIYKC